MSEIWSFVLMWMEEKKKSYINAYIWNLKNGTNGTNGTNLQGRNKKSRCREQNRLGEEEGRAN